MALIDDINALPTTIGDGNTGHLNNHQVIHAALKDHETRLGARHFIGTGSPEGRITATIGTQYTDQAATNGAIRWIKTSGTGSTGWRVEYGDTGWRDITSLLQGGWAAEKVLLRRQNSTVILSTLGLVSQNATSGHFISLPTSFHIPRTFVTIVTPGRSQSAFWNASMALTLQNYASLEVNVYADAQSTWQLGMDRAWPSPLPGTPA